HTHAHTHAHANAHTHTHTHTHKNTPTPPHTQHKHTQHTHHTTPTRTTHTNTHTHPPPYKMASEPPEAPGKANVSANEISAAVSMPLNTKHIAPHDHVGPHQAEVTFERIRQCQAARTGGQGGPRSFRPAPPPPPRVRGA